MNLKNALSHIDSTLHACLETLILTNVAFAAEGEGCNPTSKNTNFLTASKLLSGRVFPFCRHNRVERVKCTYSLYYTKAW